MTEQFPQFRCSFKDCNRDFEQPVNGDLNAPSYCAEHLALYMEVGEYDDEEERQNLEEQGRNKVYSCDTETLQTFVDSVRALNLGDGEKLWALLENLPPISKSVGKSHTKTRVVKYLGSKKLFANGKYNECKSISNFKKKDDKEKLEETVITACTNQQHMSALIAGICAPFVAEINSSPTAGPVNNNNLVSKVALMAHLLTDVDEAVELWEHLNQTTSPA